ncbi:MAG: isoprenylcysteine carboxylmethyltransferase family protein [Chloroflexota bacterium]
MVARFLLSLLFALIALIRGYYWLRFGLQPLRQAKQRAWYDWAAEIGAYSVAVVGSLYIVLGERMPLRFADDEVMRASGLALVGVGTLLFWLSHVNLARQWSWNIGLRDDHQIVRRGLYRIMRHPMYTAIGLWLIGTPFVTQSWLGLIPLVGLPGLYRRARVEEQLLTQTFGAEYETYRKETGMFLPKILD